MALPASGAISLNEIHIEAGGTTGTSATINDTDIRGLISKSSGVTMSFSEWYGASSTAAVTLNANYTVAALALNSGGAFAGIQFQADGDIMRGLSPTSRTVSFPVDIGDWASNKTGLVSGDYEWRVGNRTGDSPSLSGSAITVPTTGFTAWQNFASDFGYYFAIYGFRSCGFDLEIRIDGGTADSTAITLDVEV